MNTIIYCWNFGGLHNMVIYFNVCEYMKSCINVIYTPIMSFIQVALHLYSYNVIYTSSISFILHVMLFFE